MPFLILNFVQKWFANVSDVAQYFGFASRSQFTKYYKIELMETPGRTLMRRRYQ